MSDPINYWKLQYSMLYWTDMGSQFYCEDFSKDHSENSLSYTTLDSIYIQLTVFISHFPYGLPVSMCINRQCGSEQNWNKLALKLKTNFNKILNRVKQEINLDSLF
jgi:hypothetical protein